MPGWCLNSKEIHMRRCHAIERIYTDPACLQDAGCPCWRRQTSSNAASCFDIENSKLHQTCTAAMLRCRKPDAPAGGGKGWELSWTMTTPMVPKDECDAPIELGELLGSGSFGKCGHFVNMCVV
jgi:hypothetical protein